MSEKKDNPGFMTHSECNSIMTPMMADIKTIRDALVGTDLRGGIVKDVADMKSGLKIGHNSAILTERRKIALAGVIFSLVGIIAGHFLDIWL